MKIKTGGFLLKWLLVLCGVMVFVAMASVDRSYAATLLASYKFDEGTGTTTADSSGNGLNLTLTGTPSPTWVAGVGGTGYAYYSTATTSANTTRAVNSSTGTVLDSLTSYTITGWYNLSVGGGGRLLTLTTTGGANLELYFATSNSLIIQGGGANVTTNTSSVLGETGEWVFFAVTVDAASASPGVNWASAVKFYAGDTDTSVALVSNKGNSGTLSGLGTGDETTIRLGNNSATNRALINSSLDNISVYSGVLSAVELESIRLDAIPEPGTVALLLLGVPCILAIRSRYRR